MVGYELNTSSPGLPDEGRRLPPAAIGSACSLGPALVAMSPAPIIELGAHGKLAEATPIDPAPAYHWWHLRDQTLRIRFAQRIPAIYLVRGTMIPGHIVVAFSH